MAQKNVDAYGNAQQNYQQEQGAPAPAVAVGAGPSPGNVVAPAPVVEAPVGDDLSSQLQQLAGLHSQGILTDQEFADAKAKLISG
jgi:hypothetical protein